MIKIKNIQDAFNRAKEFFVEGCEVYFVTSDGNVFLQENKHFAYNHANKLLSNKMQVFEVNKNDFIEEKETKKRGRKKLNDGTTENNI